MKKLFLTLLTVLTCKALYALPVGNPSDASLLYDGLIMEGYCPDPCDPCLRWCDAISCRFGFYGDYVLNRHMEVANGDNRDIEDTELFTNAGIIVGNIWDRIDLFITLGGTNIYIATNESAFTTSQGNIFEIKTDTGFSWSVGLRGTLWEFGCTSLGAKAQYFRTKPHVFRVSSAAANSTYPSDIHMRYHEWQVDLGISHRINILIPYIAVKWAGSGANFNNASGFGDEDLNDPTLFNLRNKKLWGFATGVSLVDCEKASVTVEGRFGDEKAIYVNGQIRF